MSDGSNSSGRDDTFDVSESQSDLLRIVERIEALLEERKALSDDIKDVKGEAKARGFDPKIIMKVIAFRKMEPSTRQEYDALIETYRTAVGI